MAIWQLFPDEVTAKNTYDICRTPRKGRFKAIITSDHAMGTPVHFFNGRTVPHQVDNECIPCTRGRSYRWMAYFACVDQSSQQQVIFEVTAKIHAEISTADTLRDGLRGLTFVADRPSGTANGRIRILFGKGPKLLDDLPEAPDVPAVMDHVWQRSLDVEIPVNGRKQPDSLSNGHMALVTLGSR